MEVKKELTELKELAKKQGGCLEVDFDEEIYDYVSEIFENITDNWQMHNDVEQYQNLDGNIIIVFLSDFSMIVEVKEELK